LLIYTIKHSDHNPPVLDLASHCHESLLHVRGILGTGLKEWDANFISKGLYAAAAIAKSLRNERGVVCTSRTYQSRRIMQGLSSIHTIPCHMSMPRVETGTMYAE